MSNFKMSSRNQDAVIFGYRPSVIPSSAGYVIDSLPSGMLVESNGVVKRVAEVSKYEKALNTLCPTENMSKQMCFVKHRADYKEFSVYIPTDSTGTKFIRLYFGNRLNLGNAGFPRLNAAMYASLSGTIGIADFSQNNVATHIASGLSFMDVVLGNGNIEYAIKTRKASGQAEDFVTGTHGKEILDSFSLWLDGAPFSYDSAVVQAKTVCTKLEFEARCRASYPSDSATYWLELIYRGKIENGAYTIDIATSFLLSSDVNIEYAGLIMAPGSTSAQRYTSGFNKFELGSDSYTLNQFNNAITNRPGFNDAAFYNSDILCHGYYPNYGAIVSPYLTNLAVSGRYTSRTDNFNKAYWQSTNEGWQSIPAGFGLSFSSRFAFRNGDASGFDWTNNGARKILVPTN